MPFCILTMMKTHNSPSTPVLVWDHETCHFSIVFESGREYRFRYSIDSLGGSRYALSVRGKLLGTFPTYDGADLALLKYAEATRNGYAVDRNAWKLPPAPNYAPMKQGETVEPWNLETRVKELHTKLKEARKELRAFRLKMAKDAVRTQVQKTLEQVTL